MMDQPSHIGSQFRLGGITADGDFVVIVGDKKIDIMSEDKTGEDGVPEITLFANSLQKWRYPHHDEPLTKEIKEEILRQTMRLLEAKYGVVRVKVKWSRTTA
jgi:hypothetical protein